MCGKKVGTRRYLVEGTAMNLGLECARYGTPMDTPATPGSQAAIHQNLEKRAGRMASRSVFGGEADAWTLVEDFGARVHKAREAKGLTHDQLGNKVSARVPELRQIEAGKMRPSDEVTAKLEKELGIALRERIEGPAPTVSGAKKAAGGPMTIGDILRDALEKKK